MTIYLLPARLTSNKLFLSGTQASFHSTRHTTHWGKVHFRLQLFPLLFCKSIRLCWLLPACQKDGCVLWIKPGQVSSKPKVVSYWKRGSNGTPKGLTDA